jgi:tRNA threonylcarbamoyladenosine biosynthesis protein TsaB
MMILALEFSSARRSAAVLLANLRRDEVCEAIEAGAGGTHAFSLIEQALAGAGLAREQIEVIVVGLGPGSYTGIRVAISIAQGWQLARGTKLLGVSSADCLAAQAQAENIFGRVNVVMDAQRNEFYLASYETSARGWKETRPLRIVSRAEMLAQANSSEIWVGPEVTRWLPKGKILFPSAVTAGRLASGRTDFVSGDKLAPIYLRETSFVKTPPPTSMAF